MPISRSELEARKGRLKRLLSYQRRDLHADNYDEVLERLNPLGRYQIFFALWLQFTVILYGSQIKFMILAGILPAEVPCRDILRNNSVQAGLETMNVLADYTRAGTNGSLTGSGVVTIDTGLPDTSRGSFEYANIFDINIYKTAMEHLSRNRSGQGLGGIDDEGKGSKICYDDEDIAFRSIAHEWRLTGTWHAIVPFIVTVQMIGVFLGPILFGTSADRFGRRPICLALLLLLSAVGTASGFAPSWPWLAAARFIIGIFAGALLPLSFVYISEILSSNARIMFTSLQWPINYLVFALLGYLAGDWRKLSWIMNIAALPPIAMLIFGLYESPKWLLARGRRVEARNIIVAMAYRNKVNPANVIGLVGMDPDDDDDETNESEDEDDETQKPIDKFRRTIGKLMVVKKFTRKAKQPVSPTHKAVKNYHYKDLFYSRQASIECLVLFYSYFVSSVVTYGFIFNLYNVKGNAIINCVYVGLAEIGLTATTVIIPDFSSKQVFGRRVLHQLGIWLPMVVSGVIALCHGLDIAETSYPLIRVLSILGTAVNVYAWAGLIPMAIELFPTGIRSMGTSFCQVGARLGGVVASETLTLYALWRPGPFVTFSGLLAVNAILACAFLPETKNTPLPEMPTLLVPMSAIGSKRRVGGPDHPKNKLSAIAHDEKEMEKIIPHNSHIL